jgi:hypothetical protein
MYSKQYFWTDNLLIATVLRVYIELVFLNYTQWNMDQASPEMAGMWVVWPVVPKLFVAPDRLGMTQS